MEAVVLSKPQLHSLFKRYISGELSTVIYSWMGCLSGENLFSGWTVIPLVHNMEEMRKDEGLQSCLWQSQGVGTLKPQSHVPRVFSFSRSTSRNSSCYFHFWLSACSHPPISGLKCESMRADVCVESQEPAMSQNAYYVVCWMAESEIQSFHPNQYPK